jgi:ElaB/YqjD/DUF883 family membrane-anchored ribosome-binding protein
MHTTSTESQRARETAEDAREGVREFRKAAHEASGNIEGDLKALRDDFAKLADQVSGIFAKRGDAAWQHARSSVEGAAAEVEAQGREAIDAVREVSDNFANALDESLKSHPYATVALIAGVAFLFGAWRR